MAWAGAAPEPHRCDLFHWARVERPEGIQPSVILWRCLTSPIVANFCSHKWQLSKFIFFLLFGKSNYPESDIKVSQKMNNGEVPVAVNGHDELQTTIKVKFDEIQCIVCFCTARWQHSFFRFSNLTRSEIVRSVCNRSFFSSWRHSWEGFLTNFLHSIFNFKLSAIMSN